MSCNDNHVTLYIILFDTRHSKILIQIEIVMMLKGEVR